MTTRMRAALVATTLAAAGILAGVTISGSAPSGVHAAPRIQLQPVRLMADGYGTAALTIRSSEAGAPSIALLGKPHSARLEAVTGGDGLWRARIRAGVLPGQVRVRVSFPRSRPAETTLVTEPVISDFAQDGTPDSLRLDDEPDRLAFRRRFAWFAESQYYSPSQPEITDCAALLRYAYRQALATREPDSPDSPPWRPAAKYQYPFTPLGANLFRVREGSFDARDLEDGSFGQFADVRTLQRLNTHLVSRVLSAAMPGDLLFFRQDRGTRTYHSMIYLGPSLIHDDGRRYVVYHTGPVDGHAGEMRRLSIDELARYPAPEWRPLPGNPNFLGVSRWNILRKENDTRVP